MRKLLTGISIFLLTLFIGLSVHIVLHMPVLVSPIKENFGDAESTKAVEESIEPWVLKIKPCTERNDLQLTRYDRKNKSVVGLGVVNGRAVCGALPEYPLDAKKENISGVVVVDVLIDKIGEVERVEARYGHPMLLKSAEKAASQTRFSPTVLGGEVYQGKGVLMYKFDSEKGTWLQAPSAPDNPFRKSNR